MARTGRFGTLPGRPTDLSAAIEALQAQYEAQQDANFLSAWTNGGQINGKKIDDTAFLAHLKERMNGVAKSDPMYDHWHELYWQYNYNIHEKTALLQYARTHGDHPVSAGMNMASFYKEWAHKVPRNSDVWRTMMTNAANYETAARSAANAAASTAKVDQFNARAKAAQPSIDRANTMTSLLVHTAISLNMLPPNATTLDLNVIGEANLDTLLRSTRESDPTTYSQIMAVARAEPGYHGGPLTINHALQIIGNGQKSANGMAALAKRDGYSSQTSAYKGIAGGFKQTSTSLKTIRSNVADAYINARQQYISDLAAAGDNTDAQMKAGEDYRASLDPIRAKMIAQGNYGEAGKVYGEMETAVGGQPAGGATLAEDFTGTNQKNSVRSLALPTDTAIPTSGQGNPQTDGEQMSQQYNDAFKASQLLHSGNGTISHVIDPKTGGPLGTRVQVGDATKGKPDPNNTAITMVGKTTVTDPKTGKKTTLPAATVAQVGHVEPVQVQYQVPNKAGTGLITQYTTIGYRNDFPDGTVLWSQGAAPQPDGSRLWSSQPPFKDIQFMPPSAYGGGATKPIDAINQLGSQPNQTGPGTAFIITVDPRWTTGGDGHVLVTPDSKGNYLFDAKALLNPDVVLTYGDTAAGQIAKAQVVAQNQGRQADDTVSGWPTQTATDGKTYPITGWPGSFQSGEAGTPPGGNTQPQQTPPPPATTSPEMQNDPDKPGGQWEQQATLPPGGPGGETPTTGTPVPPPTGWTQGEKAWQALTPAERQNIMNSLTPPPVGAPNIPPGAANPLAPAGQPSDLMQRPPGMSDGDWQNTLRNQYNVAGGERTGQSFDDWAKGKGQDPSGSTGGPTAAQGGGPSPSAAPTGQGPSQEHVLPTGGVSGGGLMQRPPGMSDTDWQNTMRNQYDVAGGDRGTGKSFDDWSKEKFGASALPRPTAGLGSGVQGTSPDERSQPQGQPTDTHQPVSTLQGQTYPVTGWPGSFQGGPNGQYNPPQTAPPVATGGSHPAQAASFTAPDFLALPTTLAYWGNSADHRSTFAHSDRVAIWQAMVKTDPRLTTDPAYAAFVQQKMDVIAGAGQEGVDEMAYAKMMAPGGDRGTTNQFMNVWADATRGVGVVSMADLLAGKGTYGNTQVLDSGGNLVDRSRVNNPAGALVGHTQGLIDQSLSTHMGLGQPVSGPGLTGLTGIKMPGGGTPYTWNGPGLTAITGIKMPAKPASALPAPSAPPPSIGTPVTPPNKPINPEPATPPPATKPDVYKPPVYTPPKQTNPNTGSGGDPVYRLPGGRTEY